jgi:hypothetical protein
MNKEALKFVKKDKEGNYIFKRACIVDVIIETFGTLYRAMGMKQALPLVFISKFDLDFIDNLRKEKK